MMGDDFVKPVHSFLCNLIIVQFIFVIYRTLVLRRPKLNNFSIFFLSLCIFLMEFTPCLNCVHCMHLLLQYDYYTLFYRLRTARFSSGTQFAYYEHIENYYSVEQSRQHLKKRFCYRKMRLYSIKKRKVRKKKFELIIVQTHTLVLSAKHTVLNSVFLVLENKQTLYTLYIF